MQTNTNIIPYPTFESNIENPRHVRFLNLLSKVASDIIEPVSKARVAACIVYRNELISFGVNELKSHPMQAKFCRNEDSVYLHAEISAIKNALKVVTQDELSRSTLYICRVKFYDNTKRKMVFGLAKPCSGCFRCIKTFGLKRVIYTLDEGGYEEV